jgi:hypothetical protein
VENSGPDAAGHHVGAKNAEFYLLPPSCHESCESSESEASKKSDGSKKAKKSEDDTSKKSSLSKSSDRKSSDRKWSAFRDVYTDEFCVDIIYTVLHMIGEPFFSISRINTVSVGLIGRIRV